MNACWKNQEKKRWELFPLIVCLCMAESISNHTEQDWRKLVGGRMDSIETYPASEGFIAFQDDKDDSGCCISASGIFFEFIPVRKAFDKSGQIDAKPGRATQDYALVINNNPGLWGYDIGDCVRFVSLDPYKLIVDGRVQALYFCFW
ncbi:MAG: GH3 auxin-responsive promoter family protein [Saprospiraceae bacterium]|nr:GH3 auxin-responsive promoter family protein [Saprospiraceae bacterium]